MCVRISCVTLPLLLINHIAYLYCYRCCSTLYLVYLYCARLQLIIRCLLFLVYEWTLSHIFIGGAEPVCVNVVVLSVCCMPAVFVGTCCYY